VSKSRRIRIAGHVARNEEVWSDFRILTGKPIGKRSLGRPRHSWENNIRMDLKVVGVNMRNWVNLAQEGSLESPCGCGIKPPGFISHGVSLRGQILKCTISYYYIF